MKTCSEILRTAREKNNKAIEEIAFQVGLTKEGYIDLERCNTDIEQTISLKTILQICQHLNLEIGLLLGFTQQIVAKAKTLNIEKVVDDYISLNNLSRTGFEELVGWEKMPNPSHADEMMSMPIIFFQDLATLLGLEWRSLICYYVI